MKSRFLITLIAASSGLIAQQPTPTPPPEAPPATPPAAGQEAPKPVKRSLLKYTPPSTAGTGARIDGDGASRSGGKFSYPRALFPLMPKSGASLTTQARPSLFGFVSDDVNMEFRITVTEPKQARPTFIFAVSQCAAGIHRLNLADYGLTLKPNVEYKWTIAVRPDKDNRSSDLTASGTIKRIEASPALVEKLKGAPSSEHAAIYAEAGIWYDALAALSDQIAANAEDKELRAIRPDLLKQVDLEVPALADQLAADPENSALRARLDALLKDMAKKKN